MFSAIPQELKDIARWVCAWNGSKIPMQARAKKAASCRDPQTWATYKEAEYAVASRQYDFLGFVFSDADDIVGIDIDKGFDEYGLLSDLSVDVIGAARSYTEVSRSGRGVHLFLRGTLPFSGANNRNGLEIYQSSRFFITTGNQILYKNVMKNQNAIDYILEKYFASEIERKENPDKTGARIYDAEYHVGSDGKITLSYPPIPQGARNLSLTSLAGQLHTKGYTAEQILKELNRANKAACKPPLDALEVENIVKSITRYKRK